MQGSAEPRIFTPPARELTRDTTLGYDVIDFATDVLNMTLLPWQRWLLVHALEITGDFETTWQFRFRTVIVLVARQNGKTTLGAVLALFFLYVLRVGLVLGTAQDLEQAEDTWAECVEMAQGDPELSAQIKHVWYTNGAKRLQLQGGRDYRVKASTRKAGRGKSADLVFLDELREHQTWQAYAALSKTGLARANAMLWGMSNAGDGTSVVLRHFRQVAHRALGDPDGICTDLAEVAVDDDAEIDESTLGLFEWSAPPKADKNDRTAWAQANPALGFTITERALSASCASDPYEVFLTECLCQWMTVSADPPFPIGAWDAGKDERSEIAPDSRLWWGVDVSADRGYASVAVCGLTARREYHVELAAYRGGIGWLQSWFADRAMASPMTVALQSRGAPVSSMAEILAAIDGVTVVECKGPDVAGWAGRFWDAVAACQPDESREDVVPVRHRTQPQLDLAANIAATKPMGDGAWGWDRNRSLEDISPLVAVTMAFGAATSTDKTFKSVYDDEAHGLMFV